MDIFVKVIRTLIEHSTLNGADKAELHGLLDALDDPPAASPGASPVPETPAGA